MEPKQERERKSEKKKRGVDCGNEESGNEGKTIGRNTLDFLLVLTFFPLFFLYE